MFELAVELSHLLDISFVCYKVAFGINKNPATYVIFIFYSFEH